MKTNTTSTSFQCLVAISLLCASSNSEAQTYGGIVPYTNDANTVLLDHFNGGTSAAILAYTNNVIPCGPERQAISPSFAFGSGPSGLNQALGLFVPTTNTATTRSYLKYPGGELLCQSNGTLECWVYLNAYEFSIHQHTYIGECNGDVGGLSLGPTGQVMADMFYTCCTAIHFDSGVTVIPLHTWTHIAMTWGSAGAKLYINGALVGADPNTGSFTHWSDSNRVFAFVGNGGYIDEVRISNVQRANFNLPCTTCPPVLDLKMFAGLVINGPIGSNYNVQATSALGTPNWTTLTNVTLQINPYIYIDYRSPTNAQQYYRIVP